MLLEEINISHEGTYDFFYLPIDFKNKCNVGYCFINFLDPKHIVAFVKEFNGLRWKSFNSEKVCAITFARIQGKGSMVSRFQNSSLLEKDDEYRPLLFFSSGPDRGKPEPFPSSSKLSMAAQAGAINASSTGKQSQGGHQSPVLSPLSPPPLQYAAVEAVATNGVEMGAGLLAEIEAEAVGGGATSLEEEAEAPVGGADCLVSAMTSVSLAEA
jgi:hypothetical protein